VESTPEIKVETGKEVELLDGLHLDEVGRPWNADRDSRNDDNVVLGSGHSQFLWEPFRSLEHIIRVLPIRDKDRINAPVEIGLLSSRGAGSGRGSAAGAGVWTPIGRYFQTPWV